MTPARKPHILSGFWEGCLNSTKQNTQNPTPPSCTFICFSKFFTSGTAAPFGGESLDDFRRGFSLLGHSQDIINWKWRSLTIHNCQLKKSSSCANKLYGLNLEIAIHVFQQRLVNKRKNWEYDYVEIVLEVYFNLPPTVRCLSFLFQANRAAQCILLKSYPP